MKKFFSFTLALTILLSILVVPSKAATGTQQLIFSGRYDYDKSYEMLEYVNKERKSLGLQELKMDQELIEAAMLRAAEINVYFDHDRPNGEDCYTVSSKVRGENIAAGSSTASGTFEQWKNSPLHYSNMIDKDYKSIGVGCFTQGNVHYWVQLFGMKTPDAFSKPSNRNITHKMDTKQEYIDLSLRTISDYTLFVGGQNQTNVRSANKGWSLACVELDNSMVTYSSDNPKIVPINQDGVFKALDLGKANITVKCLGQTLKMTVKTQYDRTYFEYEQDNVSLIAGAKKKLSAKYTLTNKEVNDELIWESYSPDVVSVDQRGNITALSEGTAVISSKFKSTGVWFANCVVNVKKGVNPQSIRLNDSTKSVSLDSSVTMKATITPSNANQKITWRVGNTKVATVDQNGKVTAKSIGNTWLYAKTSNGLEAKCLIKVGPKPTAISLNMSSRTMSAGSSYQFKPSLTPSNAVPNLTWRTGNNKVATVDRNGKVTAKSVGNTWLYAKTANGLEAKTLIKVIPAATSVKINYSGKEIKLNQSYTFKATVNPTGASQAVTWRTGNSKVATVDQNGKVTAKGIGNTWLYAKTWNGKEAKCLIKVTNPATAITLNMSSRNMSVGTRYQFKAMIKPSNTTSTVSWRTGNSNVATVDQNGIVTAKSVGNTWLYAKTSNGLEAKTLIKVIPAATSVKITDTSKTLKPGDSYTFKAVVNPTGASQAVTWRTGNGNVATVDQNGKVTAKSVGNTWLYAKTGNGKETRIMIRVLK